jgi:hypothetical protein
LGASRVKTQEKRRCPKTIEQMFVSQALTCLLLLPQVVTAGGGSNRGVATHIKKKRVMSNFNIATRTFTRKTSARADGLAVEKSDSIKEPGLHRTPAH